MSVLFNFFWGHRANKRADWVEVESALGVWWRTAVAPVSRAIPARTWRAHPPPAKTADDAPSALRSVSAPLSLSAPGLFWYLIFALYECPVCVYKITSSVRVIVLPYDISYTICHLLRCLRVCQSEHGQSAVGANVFVFLLCIPVLRSTVRRADSVAEGRTWALCCPGGKR